MTQPKPLYTMTHAVSSILMLVLLAWLTVCLPVVNKSQEAARSQLEQGSNEAGSSDSNPLTNTNEEKSESGSSLFSEYLHEAPVMEHHFTMLTSGFKGHPSDIYLAYHPELVIPPPEA